MFWEKQCTLAIHGSLDVLQLFFPRLILEDNSDWDYSFFSFPHFSRGTSRIQTLNSKTLKNLKSRAWMTYSKDSYLEKKKLPVPLTTTVGSSHCLPVESHFFNCSFEAIHMQINGFCLCPQKLPLPFLSSELGSRTLPYATLVFSLSCGRPVWSVKCTLLEKCRYPHPDLKHHPISKYESTVVF